MVLQFVLAGFFLLWILADVLKWVSFRKRDGADVYPWNWRVLLGGFSYFAWLEERDV